MNETRPPHIGSSLDDFLSEEGIQEEAEARTVKDVEDLIRRDQERAGKLAELQRLITEGLESGISDRTADVFNAIREKIKTARGPELQDTPPNVPDGLDGEPH